MPGAAVPRKVTCTRVKASTGVRQIQACLLELRAHWSRDSDLRTGYRVDGPHFDLGVFASDTLLGPPSTIAHVHACVAVTMILLLLCHLPLIGYYYYYYYYCRCDHYHHYNRYHF